jgi:hypothetical protein
MRTARLGLVVLLSILTVGLEIDVFRRFDLRRP